MKRQLTDRNVSMIELALRIARDRFAEDAKVAKETNQPGLEKQFRDQVGDAELLRLAFEDSPTVTLEAD